MADERLQIEETSPWTGEHFSDMNMPSS